jgi:hypothetical protein
MVIASLIVNDASMREGIFKCIFSRNALNASLLNLLNADNRLVRIQSANRFFTFLKSIHMAGASGKKIAQRNATIFKYHSMAYLIILVYHTAYRMIYHISTYTNFHYFWYGVINVSTFLIYMQFRFPGVDLSQEGGLISFYFDVLYVSWFVLLCAPWSDYFYWTLILIPIFAIVKIKALIGSLFGAKNK